MRRPPAPLVALLAAAAIQAIAWAFVLPPFQGPDELGHFAYTQKLVEAGTIPWGSENDPRRHPISTEMRTALAWGGVESLRGNLDGRPPGSPVAEDLWRERDERLPDGSGADGGFTSAMANPPLYYLYAAIPYAVTSSLSIFDRGLVMRLWSVPLLLALVALTWLIAGELFGARRWLQYLATAAVALQPTAAQLGSQVNPDVLLATLWSGFFYLAILALRHGATRGRVAGLVALSAMSCLTHGRGLAILVPMALTLAILAIRRAGGLSRRRWTAVGGAVAAVAVVGAYVAVRYATTGDVTLASGRQLVSYLWQFYLPRLPFMQPAPGPPWDVRDVYVDRLFSGFAQLEVAFSPGVLDALAWLCVLVLALAVVGLVVHRRAVLRRLDVVAVLATGVVAYVLPLHLAAFRNIVYGEGDPVLTGRYVLPFAAVYGGLLALAVSWLPRWVAPLVAGAVAGGLVLVGVGSLGIVLERFYA